MYRITPPHDEKTVLGTTLTIDAAIDFARKFSKRENRTVVVRDGAKIRISSTAGVAMWVKDCPRCAPLVWPNTDCHCKGYGFYIDLPCG